MLPYVIMILIICIIIIIRIIIITNVYHAPALA